MRGVSPHFNPQPPSAQMSGEFFQLIIRPTHPPGGRAAGEGNKSKSVENKFAILILWSTFWSPVAPWGMKVDEKTFPPGQS